jgi:hypothetical protein
MTETERMDRAKIEILGKRGFEEMACIWEWSTELV